jgi:hypothetical protein
MTKVGEAGAAGRVEILGRVRDIQPSKDAPTLELYFDRQDADCFPTENRGSVALSHGGEDWRGTIGITGNNPLYLHTTLTNVADKVAVTHWLRQVGVQEGGSLRFRVHARGRLQLLEVVDVGSWREANNYGVRAEWLRAESDPRPSAPPLRREPERRLEYREALEGLRDAGGVQEQDLARLAKLQADLELSPESVERIEREVLGSPAHEAASKAMHASQTLSGGMTIDPSAAPPSCQGPDIEPGAVIDGRFEIQRLLGAGGMGRVFLARDVRLDEPVAIKFVRAEHATNPSVVERLRREVRLCRPLSHRAIVRVHDFHESADGLPFVSMEFVEGQTLRDWLDRHDHRVAVTQARSLLAIVCEGLAYAHGEGVVHLDLKPDNIMVDEGLARARILDFGIGKASGREGLDSSQVGTGTPYYMAPEQERSDGVDHRADVFSFGAIAYEVLVGTPPAGASARRTSCGWSCPLSLAI